MRPRPLWVSIAFASAVRAAVSCCSSCVLLISFASSQLALASA